MERAALLIARWPLLGDHGIQVPTTALLSLLTVKGTDTDFTYLTIVETVLGRIVGVAVNAVVLAPMHLDEPRDALRDLTTRVQDLLKDMATGLREGFDADRARGWYDTATDLGDRVPEVLSVVETGRESTRFNWRHRLRPARIDWDGYTRTVEAVRRAQWQVGSMARTLVDVADETARHRPGDPRRPQRAALAEPVPAVARLQPQIEQVPLVGEHLPRIIEQVAGRPPQAPGPTAPPPPPVRPEAPAHDEGPSPRS